ncbi:3-oxoacyl-[acyl-carrier-protein] synthase II [Atopomonas hussainii]|uniref:3-oxoacyl-[acyl-carrier-protein] synthase II n=1 Tax=Atopomonas hussainii TaxID=1429083 RepID=A0A1H7FJN0_9GAMM|nr:beta-ketoacyl synthase N-terminal-like domain-containing protein [Atopomonas hussainii]SEK24642.1 3-oxoacyl-[acyl-carrier-protein] synthase II [Atopomonas hussainii]
MSPATSAIAISGAGCVLATGWGSAALWQAAQQAQSGISALDSPLLHSRKIPTYGQISAATHQRSLADLAPNLRRYSTPAVVWGVSALQQALNEAQLEPANSPLRFGLYCSQGGYTHPALDAYHELLRECRQAHGLDAVQLSRRVLRDNALNPFLVLTSLSNGLPGVASLNLQLQGECNAFMQGVSGNLAALRTACEALQAGRVDVALVLAAGSELDPLALAKLAHGGAISHNGNAHYQPFDANAQGAIGGDGAVALVLRRQADLPAGPHVTLDALDGHADFARLPLPQAPDVLWCSSRAQPNDDRALCASLRRIAPKQISASQGLTGCLSGAPSLVDVLLARRSLEAQCVPAICGLEQPVANDLPLARQRSTPAVLRRAAVLNRDSNGFSACYHLTYHPLSA